MALRLKIAFGACLAGTAMPFASTQALEPSMNYTLHCMGCHTPDGSEVQDRVPAIRSTLRPFAGTPDGRRFLVQVPGVAHSTLTDAEIATLLNWMLENLSDGSATGTFVPYTEQEVAGYRKHALVGVRAERERLLAQMNR